MSTSSPTSDKTDRRLTTISHALMVVFVALTTAIAAEGMWHVATESMRMVAWLAGFAFIALEIGVIYFAVLAHLATRRGENPMPYIVIEWTIAILSGTIAAGPATGPEEEAVRRAAPLLAALVWTVQTLIAWRKQQRQLRRDDGNGIELTITPRRVGVWLGIVRPRGEDLETLTHEQRVRKVVKLARRVMLSRPRSGARRRRYLALQRQLQVSAPTVGAEALRQLEASAVMSLQLTSVSGIASANRTADTTGQDTVPPDTGHPDRPASAGHEDTGQPDRTPADSGHPDRTRGGQGPADTPPVPSPRTPNRRTGGQRTRSTGHPRTPDTGHADMSAPDTGGTATSAGQQDKRTRPDSGHGRLTVMTGSGQDTAQAIADAITALESAGQDVTQPAIAERTGLSVRTIRRRRADADALRVLADRTPDTADTVADTGHEDTTPDTGQEDTHNVTGQETAV